MFVFIYLLNNICNYYLINYLFIWLFYFLRVSKFSAYHKGTMAFVCKETFSMPCLLYSIFFSDGMFACLKKETIIEFKIIIFKLYIYNYLLFTINNLKIIILKMIFFLKIFFFSLEKFVFNNNA